MGECVRGHEFDADAQAECPICGEQNAALVAAERRRATGRLTFGVVAIVGLFAIAALIGTLSPLAPPASTLIVVLAIPLMLVAIGAIVSSIYPVLRARSVVRRRVEASKKPTRLTRFACPACGAENEGPFQSPTPQCYKCGTTVIGACCWRCGALAAVKESTRADGPLEGLAEAGLAGYTCEECGQRQRLPDVVPGSWWREGGP